MANEQRENASLGADERLGGGDICDCRCRPLAVDGRCGLGAIAGGYAGLHAARRVPAHTAKSFVVGVGIVLTVYFVIKPA